jgi:hypothetical protein
MSPKLSFSNTLITAPLSTSTEMANEQAVKYHLEMGFYEGTLKEPSDSEILALVCQTSNYMTEHLQLAMYGACIAQLSLTNIDYTYAEDCETAPVTVTFAAHATLCDGASVPADELYHSLELTQEDVQLYLEEFVWKSQPANVNVFYNTKTLMFEGELNAQIYPGKIPEATC